MEKTCEPDLDEVRRWIVEELDDAKAANILELDIRSLTHIADWMVVATGTSSRHVLALAERLRAAGARHGLKPSGVEGESDGEWVLLDFGDLIVHLMLSATREFYDLGGLWNERLGVQLTQARERQGEG
ncbi:MAG: ribosome silencing factor [Arenicellales bacterium]